LFENQIENQTLQAKHIGDCCPTQLRGKIVRYFYFQVDMLLAPMYVASRIIHALHHMHFFRVDYYQHAIAGTLVMIQAIEKV